MHNNKGTIYVLMCVFELIAKLTLGLINSIPFGLYLCNMKPSLEEKDKKGPNVIKRAINTEEKMIRR